MGTIPSMSLDVLVALMHKKAEQIPFTKRYIHMGYKPRGEASEQIWALVFADCKNKQYHWNHLYDTVFSFDRDELLLSLSF